MHPNGGKVEETVESTRKCGGCGQLLTKSVMSREHILPRWLSDKIKRPELLLKQYLHDEDRAGNELLRSHDLDNFVIKNVCCNCNNGWMSRLETRSMPILLQLMNQARSLSDLTDDERRTVAAWAIKTAFMIASTQKNRFELPWKFFRQLSEEPERIPERCIVFGTQLGFLPDGFLWACPTDELQPGQPVVQARVGFSVNRFHLVVVIPFQDGRRVVRCSGLHLPLWPEEAERIVRPYLLPPISEASELINVLTNMVEAGIDTRPHP